MLLTNPGWVGPNFEPFSCTHCVSRALFFPGLAGIPMDKFKKLAWRFPKSLNSCPLDFVDVPLQSRLTCEVKRHIGFRKQTNRPQLIDRTVLEVAGMVLAAQLDFCIGIASSPATKLTPPWEPATPSSHNWPSLPTLQPNPDVTVVPSKSLRKCWWQTYLHQGDGTVNFGKRIGMMVRCTLEPTLHFQLSHFVKTHSTYDEEYVETAIWETKPDFLLYDAGVDVCIHERLGRLNVTEEGIRRRDRWC